MKQDSDDKKHDKIKKNRPKTKKKIKRDKKQVRFDDMALIGEDTQQIAMFLSDEENRIVIRKSTPTKINLQSSPELRKRIRKE